MIYRLGRIILFCSAFIGIIGGCATDPGYATEFRFPVFKGNLENGKKSFVMLGCNQCHTVSGVELPLYKGETPLTFELGGKIWYVKTYAGLVTSIINPEHIISREFSEKLSPATRKHFNSPMPFNGKMTVTQLIDIVTFLNSRYELMEDYSPY